jgi:hypothetical protein
MAKAQVTGAIDHHDEVALETEVVEGLHADESTGVLVHQLGERGAADMADKMIEGFGDGEGILLGARQEIEVVEDSQFEIAQVVIGGATAAQAQTEQEQSPPTEEATVILDHGLEAGVGQLVRPAGRMGEEVANGFEKEAEQGYDLPRLRRWAVT